MERLKHMKESLMACVEGQMGNLQQVDSKELGEAIDMIKDLEEAIYYCTITKAMEEKEKEGSKEHKEYHYYTPMNYNYYPDRDMDMSSGKMYYSGQPRNEQGQFKEDGRSYMDYNYNYYGGNGSNGSSQGGSNGRSGSSSNSGSNGGRSYYEGRSPMSRMTYMESKHTHKDSATKMRDLEHYVKELSGDLVEMVEGASPEEKQYLSKKIATLASKVENA